MTRYSKCKFQKVTFKLLTEKNHHLQSPRQQAKSGSWEGQFFYSRCGCDVASPLCENLLVSPHENF